MDAPLRQRICRRRNRLFAICASCDRGHVYCSPVCRVASRRDSVRAARQRHRRSAEGRLDSHAPDPLFQVVIRRYEQKSIVITTNLPFKQWNTVFPNAACAVALIDRLTHHAEIVSIDGESYRKREAEQAQKRKQTTSSLSPPSSDAKDIKRERCQTRTCRR
jgi:hypothetical protein